MTTEHGENCAGCRELGHLARIRDLEAEVRMLRCTLAGHDPAAPCAQHGRVALA
jgi:hypothetical protein